MLRMSDHSEMRAAQRCLSLEEVEYVTQFGKRFYARDGVVYFLRRKDLPAFDQCDDRWTRLIGTAVVMTCDRRLVITVWRNRKSGLKRIRRTGSAGRRLQKPSALEAPEIVE